MYPYKLAHDFIRRSTIEMKEAERKNYSMENEIKYKQSETCNGRNREKALMIAILMLYNKLYKRKRKQQDTTMRVVKPRLQMLKGGGLHDISQSDEDQISLCNLSISNELWNESESTKSEEHTKEDDNVTQTHWKFIDKLSPNIRVDEDDQGNLLFRRYGYGLLITKDELVKCINRVQESTTIEELYRDIEVQSLYQYNKKESEGTAGLGFCAILALVGTLNPQLNTVESMQTEQGRRKIADVIDDILLPSVREYSQPTPELMITQSIETTQSSILKT